MRTKRTAARPKAAAGGTADVRLRIVVLNPPPGIQFAVQRGATAARDLVPPTSASGVRLTFDLTARIGRSRGRKVNFTGPFVQGRADERFVYVNSGQLAGDAASCWCRRAKVWLSDISAADAAAASSGATLVAEIEGTGSDGGPTCASTHVRGRRWRVVR